MTASSLIYSNGWRLNINVCGRAHHGPVCEFLCSGFRASLGSFTLIHQTSFIIYVSLWCFIDEVEDLNADRTYLYLLSGAASEFPMRFCVSKTGLSTTPSLSSVNSY